MEVKELWKPLEEYKGIEISSIGRVRKAANKRRKERILTEFPKIEMVIIGARFKDLMEHGPHNQFIDWLLKHL